MRLDEITPTIIRTWMNGLTLAASNSQRVVFANVSSILTAAVDDGELAKNANRDPASRRPVLLTDLLQR